MNSEDLKKQMTNVTTKVPREEKERIDRLAKESGIKRSEYLRNLISRRNEKLNDFIQLPSVVIVQPEQASETADIIENFQKIYPDKSGSEIILGALKVAAKHQNRAYTHNLKNVFK